jgi:hypothetical protein
MSSSVRVMAERCIRSRVRSPHAARRTTVIGNASCFPYVKTPLQSAKPYICYMRSIAVHHIRDVTAFSPYYLTYHRPWKSPAQLEKIRHSFRCFDQRLSDEDSRSLCDHSQHTDACTLSPCAFSRRGLEPTRYLLRCRTETEYLNLASWQLWIFQSIVVMVPQAR